MQMILMRQNWWATGCLGLILLTRPTLGDEPLGPGTISGRVVDAEGKGVAGALVLVRHEVAVPDRKILTEDIRADADGRFRSPPLVPVPAVTGLTVEAAGFAVCDDPVAEIAIFAGRDTDVGAIRLDRGRVFTGRVVDADGSPRDGVSAHIGVIRHYRGHTISHVGTDQNVATDADGRFRSPPLPVGMLSLVIEVPERRRAYVPTRAIRPGPGEENVGEIRLEHDVPITATVRDEAGRPVAGATIGGTVGVNERTDADGRFTIRGYGPDPQLAVTIRHPEYVGLSGRIVGDGSGLRFTTAASTGADPSPPRAADPPARDLAFTLKRAGMIEGLALDAETGKPVPLTRVRLARVDRTPGSEPELRGLVARSELLGEGRFQIPFPAPGEYHLDLLAGGYHDAGAFVPPIAELGTVGGIVVRMRQVDGAAPEPVAQAVSGVVTRDGRPVPVGWATLRFQEKISNAPNAAVFHGRTVPNHLYIRADAPIRDGAYTVSVPQPGDAYTLVVAEPGRIPTTVGPFALRAGEAKALDVVCTTGGRVSGKVSGVPAEWRGAAWVVAFTAAGLRAEAHVNADGSFTLPPLPPGEYGLKAGHDAYQDAETYPGFLARNHPESYQIIADPWKRAVRVTVVAGRDVDGVEVTWPE